MYTGKYSKKSHRRNRTKSIVLLVSALVLLVGMVGGTLAYIAAKTDNVVNNFTFGSLDPTIPEKFNGTVKTEVKVGNTTDTAAFVRAKVLVTWKNAEGKVSAVVPMEGTDYSMTMNSQGGWFQLGEFWYCSSRIGKKGESPILIDKAEKLSTASAPEGYDLSVEILAQSIQADGEKDGNPMVENFWPVNAEPNGQHPQTIAPRA